MKKLPLHAAVTTALGITAMTGLTAVSALVVSGSVAVATLNFNAGVTVCNADTGTPPSNCTYGTSVSSGSFFAIDSNGNGKLKSNDKIAISQYNGLFVDGTTTQAASGSHAGAPDGTESPGIDNPWKVFGNTGMHLATSAISVVSSDGAGHVGLDFSGWSISWNGHSSVPMGGDAANFGSTNNTGIANLTCGATCGDGDTFTLFYTAQIPRRDQSNFGALYDWGGAQYWLVLEGVIEGALPAGSQVPVTVAAGLFASGLLGLVGLTRRRKQLQNYAGSVAQCWI